MVSEGDTVWEPSPSRRESANVTEFRQWLAAERGRNVNNYHELWRWSVSDPEAFWAAAWDYYDVDADESYDVVKATTALPGDPDFTGAMPGEGWFEGATLNYVDHVFCNRSDDRPALIAASEAGQTEEISWDELEDSVAGMAAWLRDNGVGAGDRVVGYLPNVPQAVVSFLACASIGAVWSSCSPEFGVDSVVNRFRQVEPSVLVCVDGYSYGGTTYDRTEDVAAIREALPSLEGTVVVPNLGEAPTGDLANATEWETVRTHATGPLETRSLPFRHPLWVLFSSGTTGLPKPIVHGHGGIVLEHHKALDIHMDLDPGDRFFWYTSTAWMMWNYLIAGLLVGAVPVLYAGSPTHPDHGAMWDLAASEDVNLFGTSASYLLSCRDEGIEPKEAYDLDALETIGQTASPLPPEGYEYVYESVDEDVWLNSVSGGTDVCSGFLAGTPTLPVAAGELQARALGCNLAVYDDDGDPAVGSRGELVVRDPMPSMPLYFWDDLNDGRYRESYFQEYPGAWRHGDLMKLTESGTAVVYGRSDATINRQGIRMGTSEIYSVVEDASAVEDSLAVGVEQGGSDYYFPLFVVTAEGKSLDDSLSSSLKSELRSVLTPHHVPDEIVEVESIPRNLVGKKLEVPAKRLLQGERLEDVINLENTEDPAATESFARRLDRLDPS